VVVAVFVSYRDADGSAVRQLEADVVVCTIPLGVLKREKRSLFTPHLSFEKVLICACGHDL
jgi:monoamine oxidase